LQLVARVQESQADAEWIARVAGDALHRLWWPSSLCYVVSRLKRSWDFAARFSQRFFSVLWMADIAFRGSNDTRYLVELLFKALSEHVGAGRTFPSIKARAQWVVQPSVLCSRPQGQLRPQEREAIA
jgi:hypothetical protein